MCVILLEFEDSPSLRWDKHGRVFLTRTFIVVTLFDRDGNKIWKRVPNLANWRYLRLRLQRATFYEERK